MMISERGEMGLVHMGGGWYGCCFLDLSMIWCMDLANKFWKVSALSASQFIISVKLASLGCSFTWDSLPGNEPDLSHRPWEINSWNT